MVKTTIKARWILKVFSVLRTATWIINDGKELFNQPGTRFQNTTPLTVTDGLFENDVKLMTKEGLVKDENGKDTP